MSTEPTKEAPAVADTAAAPSTSQNATEVPTGSKQQVSEEEILASYPQVSAPTDQTGYTSNLTADQAKARDQLRDELKASGYTERLDDASLLRFLRARKFDVAEAKKMFVACEKWRKEFGTNTILEDFHYQEKPLIAKMYPQYYHKIDKDGRPVYFEELGKVNLSEMLKITTQERMLKNLAWEYESFAKFRLPACSRKQGCLVETSCTVLDLKGIGISSASQVLGYVREAAYMGQNYYPERMGKFYCINSPFGFLTAFRLFKPFLDPVTVSKIHILGSSYQKELLKQIPAENLPKKYGGQLDVTDEQLYLEDEGPWRDPQYIGPEGEAPRSFDMS